MQGKTINAEAGEIRKVTNLWSAEVEQRGTTVSSSAWEVTGGLTLGAVSLVGTTTSTSTTAMLTVAGSGVVTNKVTLANGEVLSVVRKVVV